MATLDKEIKVLMLKGEKGKDGQDGVDGQDGQDGKSSYELAVEEIHYSGTLEEWLESFATPENYVTRNEFKKVTQEEYDELVEAQELIPDCYYIITDDTTYDDLITQIEGIDARVTDNANGITSVDDDLQLFKQNTNDDISDITNDISNINNDITDLQEKTALKPYNNVTFSFTTSSTWSNPIKDLDENSTYLFIIEIRYVTTLVVYSYYYSFILHVGSKQYTVPYNSNTCNTITYGINRNYDNNIFLSYYGEVNSQTYEVEWKLKLNNLPIGIDGTITGGYIYGRYYKIGEVEVV